MEEKISLPVARLPLSKQVQNELYSKGIYNLGQIVDKFHMAPGRIFLPGFTDRVFSETGYLLVSMGLDYGEKDKEEYNILDTIGNKLCRYASKQRRTIIDSYANKEF